MKIKKNFPLGITAKFQLSDEYNNFIPIFGPKICHFLGNTHQSGHLLYVAVAVPNYISHTVRVPDCMGTGYNLVEVPN